MKYSDFIVTPNSNLSAKYLRKILRYNPKTGFFVWRVNKARRVKAGMRAGTLNNITGYIQITIDSQRWQAHRLAWLWMTGEFPPDEIDHINHVRDDNRFKNLRVVDHIKNLQNQVLQSNNTSGINGVCWNNPRHCWQAQIRIDGRQIHLGYFDNLEDAEGARLIADLDYGFHDNHGKAA